MDNQKGKSTLLHLVVKNSITELLERLTSTEDVNAFDENGNTALYYLVQGGFLEESETLIDAGAYLDYIYDGNLTLLDIAVERQFTSIVELLLSHDCAVETDYSSPLLNAIFNDDVDTFDVLLEYSDINASNSRYTDEESLDYGMFPIHAAVANPYILQMLIKYGVDVNQRSDIYYTTPLMLAGANTDSIEGIKILISNGADIDAIDANDNTFNELILSYHKSDVVKEINDFIAKPINKYNKYNN